MLCQHRAKSMAIDLHVRVAGFGGQGVLLLGEILAEAGLDAGLEVSWLPSYGPEMRSGTSNCHVRVAKEPIDSPLVTVPDFLVAMNEPSLHKFDLSVKPGGWVIYNGDVFPADCERERRQCSRRSTLPALADELGNPRAANMVMLGALLEIAGGCRRQVSMPLCAAWSKARTLVPTRRSRHWREGASFTANRAKRSCTMTGYSRSESHRLLQRQIHAAARCAGQHSHPCSALRHWGL